MNCNLIHPTSDRWDWCTWFEKTGVVSSGAKHERIFDTAEMAITAAIAGMGVAVIDLTFIQSELADGRLVAPLDVVVREGTGYCLFTKRGRFQERKIKAFVEWLLKQAQEEEVGR